MSKKLLQIVKKLGNKMIKIKIKKNKITLLFLILWCVLLTSCSKTEQLTAQSTSPYEGVGFVMGTVVTQTIYSDDENVAKEITELLADVEENRISWRVSGSEIVKINNSAKGGSFTKISADTKEDIEKALDIARNSNGAFDPAVGALTQLWDFDDQESIVPEEENISASLESVDYHNITLSGDTVGLDNNAILDMGAIGKGIGCDEVEKYLDDRGDINGMLMNLGGSSILTYGKKDSDDPWKVAILNPRDTSNYLGALTLQGTYHIATSGDYEKYFEVDGIRYHHILDPKTGYPAQSGLISVTVVSKEGAVSDGLSTACFVLGKDNALELLKQYDADAIFVDEDKNVYVTEGLTGKFQLLAEDDYQIVAE